MHAIYKFGVCARCVFFKKIHLCFDLVVFSSYLSQLCTEICVTADSTHVLMDCDKISNDSTLYGMGKEKKKRKYVSQQTNINIIPWRNQV